MEYAIGVRRVVLERWRWFWDVPDRAGQLQVARPGWAIELDGTVSDHPPESLKCNLSSLARAVTVASDITSSRRTARSQRRVSREVWTC